MIKKLIRRYLGKLGFNSCYHCGRWGWRFETYPVSEESGFEPMTIYPPMRKKCINMFEAQK